MSKFKAIHPSGLPVFKAETGGKVIIYTPGNLAVVSGREARLIEGRFAGDSHRHDKYGRFAEEIESAASDAVRKYRALSTAPFEPECLTVYLSNKCNLKCGYCFSKKSGRNAGPAVNEKIVRSAAMLVAENCAKKKKRFDLVVHGGGEPGLYIGKIRKILSVVRDVSGRYGIGHFAYIATNGVLPLPALRFIAREFDLVGLSCDGPANIQDKQRPLLRGKASSAFVERAARIIRAEGGSLTVRATITPRTMERQAEIISYLHERLGAVHIRFEPVYRVYGKGGFKQEQAETFVRNFMKAKDKAGELGCELGFSGARLDEIHGPYCNVLKNVLQVNPDGSAYACQFCIDSGGTGKSFIIGNMNGGRGEFMLYKERISEMSSRAGGIPARCKECINAYHCVRACPDECFLEVKHGRSADSSADFRCNVQRRLTEEIIIRSARGKQ